MIRAVIVEDEKKSRETLMGLLNRYCPSIEVVAQAEGYKSGLAAIKANNPDVVFLDIQMPDGSGFKVLEDIEDINFEVIFTTAYDQFAIKAIKYSALDYLLKPIVPEELQNAVEKVEAKLKNGDGSDNINVLLNNLKKNNDEPKKIVLSTAAKMYVIGVDEIIRCESDNYYTRFFFTDGSKLLISKTLKENEALLSDHNFIRPHKSHLINISFIKGFNRNHGGHIIMKDETEIPVSRRKREKIVDIINHL
jgi:two-component system, LytTR family, response regulator